MSHAATHDAERRIDNIEFNVADIARSKRFYGEVFGWHFTDYGAAYTEFDDGRLKGGFVADAPVRAHGGPLVILYCADLADAQQRVITAGGEVVLAVFAFPGGRRFQFRDLDGYELAVWSDAT
ncbi:MULTISPECIES: VOC family protein [Stenotrophomonas maltophilia group]|uniref:VOC family protein n=1 Tax=Stenotrophomonas maltophilia group TaxID=995085 RepID=UPI00066AA9A8|nr:MULTISPECIES: VOC family protein [Stenotrophomonas maltophilia group]ELK6803471.1 VOC family protein [Stenotrophomonas maltophilia]MBA0399143.1 glyoxalase/bleomycin resistance/extradiol dioxygenase family protein [Stenotrophomonas maltophilia]MCU1136252.1 VOC family protein [Stenotrophomonas maltophilia]MCU1196561.1 VOC family protein [Stenotrophomonas maltophilia]MDT3430492.1 VOC family protein [Stenotrophomonas maltophilia]